MPSADVDRSPSDFDAIASPAGDVAEDAPGVSNVGLFEATIDNDVLVVALSDELNIIDKQAKAVGMASALKLQFILSLFSMDNYLQSIDVVVVRTNRSNNLIVPDNVSLA